MATIRVPIFAREAIPAATNGAQHRMVEGTNYPVPSLEFDGSTSETAYFPVLVLGYGSGNLTATIGWYADTASTGNVVFGASIAAITPNTDTQDVETKAFATEVLGTDTHLGTTGQRLHEFDITINQLDSVASGDAVMLRLARKTADASDDMAGNALVTYVILAYSDT